MRLILFLLSSIAFGQMLPGPGGNVTVSSSTTARLFTSSTDTLTGSSGSAGSCYLHAGETTWTMAMWFKSSDVTQTNTYVFENAPSGNQDSIIYGFANDGAGHAQIEFFATGGTGGTFRTGSQITILDTNWHHIAYRYDGTNWDKFLDGTKTSINSSFTGTLSNASCGTFTVGLSGSTVSAGVARVFISNAALTDMQIATMAGATCSTSGVSGTLAYWLLDGSSPEAEHSPSGNTNSLTVSGATTTTGPTCSGS